MTSLEVFFNRVCGVFFFWFFRAILLYEFSLVDLVITLCSMFSSKSVVIHIYCFSLRASELNVVPAAPDASP